MTGGAWWERAARHPERPAIQDSGAHTYGELLVAAERIAAGLLAGADDLREARVAFLAEPGIGFPAALWGIWRAGGVAVPLCPAHPPPEMEYVVRDAGASVVAADETYAATGEALAGRVDARFSAIPGGQASSRRADLPRSAGVGAPHPVPADRGRSALREEAATSPAAAGASSGAAGAADGSRRALILYTSGTTARPKGVVSTHAGIEAQVRALVEAWEWMKDDRILHALPLHHIHRIVNALLCPLWAGACVEFLPRFDAARVWERLTAGAGEQAPTGITLFMGVPTMYERLIAAWEAAPAAEQGRMSAAAGRLRLWVSGSAALPARTLAAWERISGQRILERYGMTETGMILSNPLRGERRPECVGTPLPGVEARLVDEDGQPVPPGTPGEVEVRGPAVFREYWGQPEATRAAFRDRWFRTGDLAVVEEGSYRLLGRLSVDIIKTGGYKVSALEIEQALRDHPAVAEVAVVGLPDAEWGERVAAAVVLRHGEMLDLDGLRAWSKERMAAYKVPSRLRLLPCLPRNPIGKVLKPELARGWEGADE